MFCLQHLCAWLWSWGANKLTDWSDDSNFSYEAFLIFVCFQGDFSYLAFKNQFSWWPVFIDVTNKCCPLAELRSPQAQNRWEKGQYRLEKMGNSTSQSSGISLLGLTCPGGLEPLEQHAPCFEFMEDLACLWKSSLAQSQKMQSLGIPGAEMCQPLPRLPAPLGQLGLPYTMPPGLAGRRTGTRSNKQRKELVGWKEEWENPVIAVEILHVCGNVICLHLWLFPATVLGLLTFLPRFLTKILISFQYRNVIFGTRIHFSNSSEMVVPPK